MADLNDVITRLDKMEDRADERHRTITGELLAIRTTVAVQQTEQAVAKSEMEAHRRSCKERHSGLTKFLLVPLVTIVIGILGFLAKEALF